MALPAGLFHTHDELPSNCKSNMLADIFSNEGQSARPHIPIANEDRVGVKEYLWMLGGQLLRDRPMRRR
ncbi:hypothetical protein [Glaciihabitans sp. UYNi722]|uniref:hypothetical protein n=1 Tax=Glaciihabitans sp. UYNi722 TaxID=3156344 RepID=UPI0033976F6F